MKVHGFEKLEVWKEAKDLSIYIYKVTSGFPKSEIFGLTNQMRRASVSVCSNIAEGTSRFSKKDEIRFYEIAYGSLMELLNQSIISSEISYLSLIELSSIREKVTSIGIKLSNLRTAANNN